MCDRPIRVIMEIKFAFGGTPQWIYSYPSLALLVIYNKTNSQEQSSLLLTMLITSVQRHSRKQLWAQEISKFDVSVDLYLLPVLLDGKSKP